MKDRKTMVKEELVFYFSFFSFLSVKYCSTDITLMLSVIALFWLYCVYMVVAS